MKVSSALYECNNGTNLQGLGLYGKYSDIYTALPPSMKGEHLIHFKYEFEGKNKSIDIYAVDNYSNEHLDLKRKINTNANASGITPQKVSEIFAKHNVQAEVVERLRDTPEEKELYRLAAFDLQNFCRNPAKNITGTSISYVPKIIPVTKVEYPTQEYYTKSGKAEFVDECPFKANLDFVLDDSECATSFVPMGPEASFDADKGIFTGFYDNTFGSCQYCYAASKHKRPYPKSFVKIDPDKLYCELKFGNYIDFNEKFSDEPVRILRLGKRTETGAKYNRPQLITTLETCIETGTKVVMPTKMLEFDPALVELIKKSRTQLLYSMTNLDSLERGALMHGCSNEWRLDQAIKYKEAGVDVAVYLTLEVVYDTKPAFKELIRKCMDYNIKFQILGLRIPATDLAFAMTGRTWEQLKGRLRMAHQANSLLPGHAPENMQIGGYVQEGNNNLLPNSMNPYLRNLIGDNHGNIRGCYHNKLETICGKCFQGNGCIVPTKKMNIKLAKRYNKRDKEKTGKLDFKFE